MVNTRPFEERFWEKVDKQESCWIWTGALICDYGVIFRGGRMVRAHRASYETHNDADRT